MNNLIKRVLVAVIGIPVFILIILAGNFYFLISILLISSLCIWEFLKMTENKNSYPIKYLSLFFNIINISVFYYFINLNDTNGFLYALLSSFIILILFNVFNLAFNLFNNKENNIFNISVATQSYNYLSYFFLCLLILREFSNINSNIFSNYMSYNDYGWFVLGLFITIWSADTAAYFIGTAFGKHRLFERISPKKSWEGAIAGFVFSIIAFTLTMFLSVPQFPITLSIVLGAVIGIVATIGDLAESQLKRDAKVKDSSNLIPGHGGVFDRFDSIIFSSPIVLIILFTYLILSK